MSEGITRPSAVDERLRATAAELGYLGYRVQVLAQTVDALVGELRTTPGAVPGGAGAAPSAARPPEAPAPSGATAGPSVPPGVSGGYPTGPESRLWTAPTGESPAPQEYPVPLGPRRPTAVERLRVRLTGPALLAATGGAVTLLGVVLLLVLAASRGWFSPAGRVAAGAVLGLALVGLALWLYRRSEARTGALALAGTGVAALYLDVAAATALYDLLPTAAALAAALVIAGGGLALADRWRSRGLAVGVVIGAAVLAPVVADGFGPLLPALVLVLQAVTVPVVARRAWGPLAGVAGIFPAFYGAIAIATGWPLEPLAAFAAVGIGVLAVGLAAAVFAVLASVPRRVPASLVVGATVPLLVLAGRLDGLSGAGFALLATLGAGAVAAWRCPPAVRITALATASVALLVATVAAFDGGTQQAVLLGEAVAALVASAALRSRPALATGTGFGLVGLVAALDGGLPVRALVEFPTDPFAEGAAALLTGLLLAVLVLAAAVAGLVAAGRTGLVRADSGTAVLWVPAALIALYGAAGAILAPALLIAPDRTGFVAGHALVTVSWTVAALVLLARGVARPALRVAGMVLVAAAVGKLVLFDLVALDGVARVAAFLGAGLVLLAAGSRYARLVARHESSRSRL